MIGECIKCRAVVFPYPERAEMRDGVALPPVDEDSVVIKTRCSSISRGTEMDLYHARFHDYGQFYPMLPGYEPAGEVIFAGRNVSHLKPGDRAVVSNLFAGFDRRYCVAWGGQAEYVVVNKVSVPDFGLYPDFGAGRANRIPDGLSCQEACLSVLAAVAYHGIERIDLRVDDTVAVIGQGCLGLMSAQIARGRGARVIVSDLYENRLETARAVGLEETVNASRCDQVREVLQRTGGRGANVVINATGDVRTYELAWPMVRDHGTVHAQGMALDPLVLKVNDTIFAKSLRFSSSCGEYPRHQREVLRLMAEGKILAAPLISRETSCAEATAVYEQVDKKPGEVLKVILHWE